MVSIVGAKYLFKLIGNTLKNGGEVNGIINKKMFISKPNVMFGSNKNLGEHAEILYDKGGISFKNVSDYWKNNDYPFFRVTQKAEPGILDDLCLKITKDTGNVRTITERNIYTGIRNEKEVLELLKSDNGKDLFRSTKFKYNRDGVNPIQIGSPRIIEKPWFE
jgi:hypothetical protein